MYATGKAGHKITQFDVQPFTSTKNRLHCIINPHRLPPIAHDGYSAEPSDAAIKSLPLRVFKGTRLAQCWHSDGANRDCMIHFDTEGTPRIGSVLTPTLEAGSVVRVAGHGIDGAVVGQPAVYLTLYRGETPAVGVCGEKGCQASTVGTSSLGCNSRFGSSDVDAQPIRFASSASLACWTLRGRTPSKTR